MTDDDIERLKQAATRFIARHSIANAATYVELDWELSRSAMEPYGTGQHARYLCSLWRRAVKRALRHPRAEGIAWGYVGFQVA